MKASRQVALEQQLASAERDLLERLRAILPRAASSGEPIFSGGRFLPPQYQERWVSPAGRELLDAADDCIAQREALGLPTEGTAAALYLAACSEAADVSNHARRGPRKLAAWLLSQIDASAEQPNNSLERSRER